MQDVEAIPERQRESTAPPPVPVTQLPNSPPPPPHGTAASTTVGVTEDDLLSAHSEEDGFLHFHTTTTFSVQSAIMSLVTQIERQPPLLCITRSCGTIDRLAITLLAVHRLQAMISELEEAPSLSVADSLSLRRFQEDRAILEGILSTLHSVLALRPKRRHDGRAQSALHNPSGSKPKQIAAAPVERPQTCQSVPRAHPSPDEWTDDHTISVMNAHKKYDPYERPRTVPGALDPLTQSRMVHRLHDVCMSTKARNREEVFQKMSRIHGESDRRVLTPGEVQDLGDRLYYKQRVHSQRVSMRLQQMYCPERAPSRKLTQEETEAQGKRLYYNTLQRKKDNHDSLMKAYIESTDLPRVKISTSKINEMLDRLSKSTKDA